MTKDAIRVLQEIRNLSYYDWEELKAKLLNSCNDEKVVSAPSRVCETRASTNYAGRVYNICKEIGMPSNIKGYRYVQRAILLTIEDPKIAQRVTKLLYPTVAKEFDSTMTKVERAIRTSIEICFQRGNMEKLNEIFAYTYSSEKGKPTNLEFITAIADYVLHS